MFSGLKSTFNHFIESTKDDLETGTEVLAGNFIHNATKTYNNMVATKELTKIDPKDDRILALTTCLTKLEKDRTYVLAIVTVGGGNRTHTRTNIKGRDPNKSYVEVINNIESWMVKLNCK